MKLYFRKYWWIAIGLALVGVVAWWFGKDSQVVLSPEAPWVQVEKPLEKYSFPKLRETVVIGSEIKLDRVMADEVGFTSYLFFYEAEGGRISGQINVPKTPPPKNGFPVVVMIRGYVDQEIYTTGIGTSRVAAVLARNGFITLAPDFLGYGESEMPPNNSLHERFMRPFQVIQLMASIGSLKQADKENISMWGHSNGGQIALSVLQVSGKQVPTSLWAPVSKPFPYSILYYTDEFDDRGKALRRLIAGFEAQYEADLYSIENYYEWLEAPIQIHQGTNDDAVPLEWSVELNERLQELEKSVELFVYTGADHNLVGGWDTAVRRDLNFFSGI